LSFKRNICAIILAILAGGNLFLSCERQLDLSLFRDEYGEYEPEVRIEAVINPIFYPSSGPPYFTVIVRIDRSITIDDTTVFNGRDDNDNWRGYRDENGNGRWNEGEPLNDDLGEDGIAGQTNGFPARDEGEGNGRPDYGEPNVDEYDEILPLIHDTSAVVRLTNLNTRETHLLAWQKTAKRFQYVGNNRDDDFLSNVYFSFYGGYTNIGNIEGLVDTNNIFEFAIELPNRNLTVKGQTHPVPPPVFINKLFPQVKDTLFIPYGSPAGILWQSDPRATVYSVRVEVVLPDLCEPRLFYEHPNFANQALTAANEGVPVGYEPITSELNPGLYRMVVITLDENYSRYYYSSLSLKDPEKSNLRDQYGNVVMGVAGSKAESRIYFRIVGGGVEDLAFKISKGKLD